MRATSTSLSTLHSPLFSAMSCLPTSPIGSLSTIFQMPRLPHPRIFSLAIISFFVFQMSQVSAPGYSPAGSHNKPGDFQARTHVNATAVNSFKTLSIKVKLRVCKELEQQNDVPHERTRFNASDPANRPEPGSETTSSFSLDDGDLEKLRHPSFANLFRDVMPTTYVANWLH